MPILYIQPAHQPTHAKGGNDRRSKTCYKRGNCLAKCSGDMGVKGTGTRVRLTFGDRSAGNDHHGQDVVEIETSHGWPLLGLAATLCRSGLTAPVCPLIRPRLQVANSDSLPRLVTTAARQALPIVLSMRCGALRCDAMQRPNCRGGSQSVPANRAHPPMALPLTRKPGLDAMEQSGSTKGRYCLVQPAWLVPSICSVSIWYVGSTLEESMLQGPTGSSLDCKLVKSPLRETKHCRDEKGFGASTAANGSCSQLGLVLTAMLRGPPLRRGRGRSMQLPDSR